MNVDQYDYSYDPPIAPFCCSRCDKRYFEARSLQFHLEAKVCRKRLVVSTIPSTGLEVDHRSLYPNDFIG